MQLILDLLNSDFHFTDQELFAALSQGSEFFRSKRGLGDFMKRFAAGEFKNDPSIGQAFLIEGTPIKVGELSQLYNLAESFRVGDKSKKIKANLEKCGICLALICHKQVQVGESKHLDELAALYSNDKKITAAINKKKAESLALGVTMTTVDLSSLKEPAPIEQKVSSSNTRVNTVLSFTDSHEHKEVRNEENELLRRSVDSKVRKLSLASSSGASNNPAVQHDHVRLYAAQQAARSWKTALAIVVSVFSGLLLAVPAYLLWRRAKQSELIQKFEMKPKEYADLKQFRHSLVAQKLENEKITKPHKAVIESPDNDPNKKAVYLMDKAQAHRFEFFAGRLKKGNNDALTAREQELLIQSKEESLRLVPR